jgi:hypothetical protein
MNRYESHELHSIESEVQEHRQRVESALEAIEDRVRFGARRFRLIGERVNAPLGYVRENPVSAAIVLGLAGFYLGSRLQERFGSTRELAPVPPVSAMPDATVDPIEPLANRPSDT